MRAGAPRAAGSSPSATKEPSVTRNSSNPPEGRRFHYPKSRRLLRSKDFRKVYDKGVRWSEPLFGAVWLRGEGGIRIGFSAPKALGGAVVRNRIRRRLREAIRLEAGGFAAAGDLVLHPRKRVLTASFEEIRSEVRKVLARCSR